MLQQTGVSTVRRFYGNFLRHFPTLMSLALASEDQILGLWSGLGFYRRARNMHVAAQKIMDEMGGVFPIKYEDLISLPGIGRSTAGAILVFAFGKHFAILDGNVKRVLSRYFAIEEPINRSATVKELWKLSESLLPKSSIESYTQGLMDLGATICLPSKPNCVRCPLVSDCSAKKNNITHLIPRSIKRKSIPHRETIMLILSKERRFVMEKRPLNGVWPGLISFPEITELKLLDRTVQDSYGFKILEHVWISSINHKFSHFDLLIRPLLIDVCGEASVNRKSVWVGADEALAMGIPRPIRNIILNLRENYDF